jgi:hypothetical protein
VHSDINDSTLIERVVYPTLSELIEACPKQMGTATFVLGSANLDAPRVSPAETRNGQHCRRPKGLMRHTAMSCFPSNASTLV